MSTVTRDVKDSRRKISKTARRRLSPEKTLARRHFRSRLKASDRNNEWDGCVRPAMTKLHVT